MTFGPIGVSNGDRHWLSVVGEEPWITRANRARGGENRRRTRRMGRLAVRDVTRSLDMGRGAKLDARHVLPLSAGAPRFTSLSCWRGPCCHSVGSDGVGGWRKRESLGGGLVTEG